MAHSPSCASAPRQFQSAAALPDWRAPACAMSSGRGESRSLFEPMRAAERSANGAARRVDGRTQCKAEKRRIADDFCRELVEVHSAGELLCELWAKVGDGMK